MRHAFLVALCLCIADHAAHAQLAPATGGSHQSPEVFVVEDDGKGALLIFLGSEMMARCAAADQKLECEVISPRAQIVPVLEGQPSPEGLHTSSGAR